MKKYIFILFLASSFAGYSQNDSITLVNGKWKENTIAPGVIYKFIHFENKELFESNQYISIIEIGKSSGATLELFPSPVLKETSKMAAENGALAAINGSFFKFNYNYNTEDYNSVDYIRKNGKNLAPNTIVNKQRSMHQLGALAFYNKELYIIKADEIKEWEKYIQAQDVLTTGPILRVGGVDEKLSGSSFYTTRHPRTAIAKKGDGTIMLVTIDGRNEKSNGVSIKELQSILRWMGASDIINLDGGGSTTMYIEGYSDNGVVNHPTDNKLFDNKGERKVANAILLFRQKK